LFQGPTASNDEAYFGLTRPFESVKFTFAAVGVQNAAVTLVWEYWNGSAWTALTVTSDTTSELTQNGTVKWSVPGAWSTTSVNSQTAYWARVRFTAGSWTTNPTVDCCTITGWQEAFSAANKRTYRMGGSLGYLLDVDDSGPGAGGAREARVCGFLTATGIFTGTGQFPTADTTFITIGSGQLAVRKSSSADATSRAWYLVCDDRTFYTSFLNNDATTTEWKGGMGFGEYDSFIGSADIYRVFIMARAVENNASYSSTGGAFDPLTFFVGGQPQAGGGPLQAQLASFQPGHFLARSFTGIGSAVAANKSTLSELVNQGTYQGPSYWYMYPAQNEISGLRSFNPPSASFIWAPCWINEANMLTVRGRLRGMWVPCAVYTFATNFDEFEGSLDLAGRTLKLITPCPGPSAIAWEISDTWETT
jgi:hypothetical protein